MENPQLVSLNNLPNLTAEELEKYKQKILKRREYQKEYMKKKRENDPEYVKKCNEIRNNAKKERYKNDADFNAKQKEYGKQYSAAEREKIKLVKENYKSIFGVEL
jgi:hypothetical protein